MDVYQERYLMHQARKKAELMADEGLPRRGQKLSRRSRRRFVPGEDVSHAYPALLGAVAGAPSSCNRQAVKVLIVDVPHDKVLLGHQLVGGKGWISEASAILLFFARYAAYRAPGETRYMPYMDMAIAMYVAHTAACGLGLASCIVCPNIRPHNIVSFHVKFQGPGYVFGGALPIGVSPGVDVDPPEKRDWMEVLL